MVISPPSDAAGASAGAACSAAEPESPAGADDWLLQPARAAVIAVTVNRHNAFWIAFFFIFLPPLLIF